MHSKHIDDITIRDAFDRHRDTCKQCDSNPFGLCVEGGDLLITYYEAYPPEPFPRPWPMKRITGLVAKLLRENCACGEVPIWKSSNVACPRWFTANDVEDAKKHFCFPIDTGPFSLGRRVD